MRILEEAKRVFAIEAQAILELAEKINGDFIKAIEILKNTRGKVVVTGMGKSGLVGRKIASTLSSTGTAAIFLHPAECSHGDLGVIGEGDVVMAISYGGESSELQSVITFSARKGVPLVVLTGKTQSSLAQAATVILDVSVKQEACPLGLAPTASTTATLAMGDALAVALMQEKGFQAKDFAEFHPGGSLGRRLLTRVQDVMHSGAALPVVQKQTPMKEVLSLMTRKEVRGVAGVTDSEGFLLGVITDGDIRRRLEQSKNPLSETAGDVMSLNPKTIGVEELAERALFVMEQFKIQTLFAINKSKDQKGDLRAKPLGLIHLQDLLQAKIR